MGNFKTALFAGVGALALFAALPAQARLQLSISSGGSTFSCFDGELSCDVSGGANNLLTIDQTVGNAFVQITLAQSTFGKANTLQLSSSSIVNEGLAPITVNLVAGDTGFLAPTTFINSSGSLTFNNAVGSGISTLTFFADPLNAQGANPLNTPGLLLESVSGTPLTDPDSFSGSKFDPFVASGPFSMTEAASLALRGSASITGFNQSMESGVPEPSTWAMLAIGFGFMAWGAMSRKKARELIA